jgi:hypothetical protein
MNYKNGCIFNALNSGEIKCLAHICNQTVGMGAGIAKKIADLYPNIRQADYEFRTNKNFDFVNLFKVNNGFIANIYAMINPGCGGSHNDTFVDRIERTIKAFEILQHNTECAPIGIPLILSDLARDKMYSYMSPMQYFKNKVAPYLHNFNLTVYYL